MKVPTPLTTAFGPEFESQIAEFATREKLLPSVEELKSVRFLSRSVIPHVRKLSETFNRIAPEPAVVEQRHVPERGRAGKLRAKPFVSKAVTEEKHRAGLDPYWKESSNPENLRLAYFLYFMPSNLYRVASVWAELARLGYRWPHKLMRAIEFGAGPASGACGIAAGEKHAPVGLPKVGNWALIERDRAMLDLGSRWAENYFESQGQEWTTRNFHRTLDLAQPLLPPGAPTFHLWVMSYFLNESPLPASELARNLIQGWEKHLEEDGIAIIIEPALRLQSRRLLELRRELLAQREKSAPWLQILLPCLGHQACGALAAGDDWCHEEVSWWRPPYFRVIDDLAHLDRKTLPFSYLVVTRSKKTREEILPALALSPEDRRYRLVSPAHGEGKELEFFLCGQDGKRRTRYRPNRVKRPEGGYKVEQLGRGDILTNVEVRGDQNASRVERMLGKNLIEPFEDSEFEPESESESSESESDSDSESNDDES